MGRRHTLLWMVFAALAGAAVGACGTTVDNIPRSVVATEPEQPKIRYVQQILRSELAHALREGPGRLLQRVQLYPFRDGERFVGYQITALFPGESVEIAGIYVGDILLKVNDYVIDRPDKLMALWVALEQAPTVTVEVLRVGKIVTTTFPVIDDVTLERPRPRLGSPDSEPAAP